MTAYTIKNTQAETKKSQRLLGTGFLVHDLGAMQIPYFSKRLKPSGCHFLAAAEQEQAACRDQKKY